MFSKSSVLPSTLNKGILAQKIQPRNFTESFEKSQQDYKKHVWIFPDFFFWNPEFLDFQN